MTEGFPTARRRRASSLSLSLDNARFDRCGRGDLRLRHCARSRSVYSVVEKERTSEETGEEKKDRGTKGRRFSPMACPTILKEGARPASLPRREVAFRCRRNGSREEERKRERMRVYVCAYIHTQIYKNIYTYIYTVERQFTGLSSQVMLLRVPKTPIFARSEQG